MTALPPSMEQLSPPTHPCPAFPNTLFLLRNAHGALSASRLPCPRAYRRPPSRTAIPLSKQKTRKQPFKRIAFEDGIFEDIRSDDGQDDDGEEGGGGGGEEEDSEEEDSQKKTFDSASRAEIDLEDGLVPREWKPLQMELYISRTDKKREIRMLEIANRRRNARLAEQKRENIRIIQDGFGQAHIDNWTVGSDGKPGHTLIQGREEVIDKDDVVHRTYPGANTIREEEKEVRDEQDSASLSSGSEIDKFQTLSLQEKKDTVTQLPYSVAALLFEKKAQADKAHADWKSEPDSGLDLLFTEEEKLRLNEAMPDLSKLLSEKWPMLHTLVSAGQFLFADRLLKLNLDVNARDEDGYTALQRAVLGRKETAVTQLLRAGADVQVFDKDGASLLHLSVQTGSLNLARLFIKHRININHADEAGWTPLHLAVTTGRDDIVRLLLVSGADASLRNKDGQTPFHMCLALGRTFNCIPIAKALKKHGNNSLLDDELYL